MSNIFLRKNLSGIFLLACIAYVSLMMFACLIADKYTLKHSGGVILSALSIALTSKLYVKRRNYFIPFSLLTILACSIFFIKLRLGNFIDLNILKTYMNFMIASINLAFLVPLIIKNSYACIGVRFFMLWLTLAPSMLIWGYYCTTGAWFAADTLLAILQTNLHESIEYISDYFSLSTLGAVLAFNALIVVLAIKTEQINISSNKKTILLILCMVLSLIGIFKYRHNIVTDIPKQASKILEQYSAFSESRNARKENIGNLLVAQHENAGVYVLVIGESQNKDHMGAYGYNRETTPWLSQMVRNKNMILFSQAFSCHTHTVPTLLYALTAKNQYNKLDVKNAVSILEVAEAAGYETVWLSNQVKFSAWDTPITSIASEANQQKWINSNIGETTATDCFDGNLVDQLDKITLDSKMLIVIHLMGNHGSYEQRYLKNFRQFINKNNIDQYDNSIVYNDYVMSKLWERLKAIPNFKGLIYCSDHADAVDKNLGHDASKFDFDMTHIPLYIYLSDSYIKENPVKYDILQHQKNQNFTNDLLFNLLLGIMKIDLGDMYEPDNDVTSATFDNNIDRFTTLYGKKHLTEERP